MKALIVVAHGSRRSASNDEVRELVAQLEHHDHSFDIVLAAFLELAEPLIPDGIRHSIEQGATNVVVMPYFLSAGRHVVEDIPADVDIVKKEYPDIPIRIAPYIGSADQMGILLLQQVEQ